MPKRKPTADEAKNQAVEEIAGLVDAFCKEYLNDEYADLCRRLTEKLARERPSPLMRGKSNAWACGIVRTIGLHNFLGDKSQKPYMKISDISRIFGVGESTAAARSATIRNMLRLGPLDFEWLLPSRAENNPLVWMLNVNGFMMDIRDAPREAQEVAFEQGLIPYIPADRQQGGCEMNDGDSMWSRKGATLSDKSARQEFGLTQQEIIAAIRAGKLQFRESNMYGNTWYRLLRHEVESLVQDKSGLDQLHKKKLEKELADLNKERMKLTIRLKVIERRQAELRRNLTDNLDALE